MTTLSPFDHYLNPNGERIYPNDNCTKDRVVRDIIRAAKGFPFVKGAVIQESRTDPGMRVVLMGDIIAHGSLPNHFIRDPSNESQPIVEFGDYMIDRVELTHNMNPVLHLITTRDGLPAPQIVQSREYELFLDRYIGCNVLAQSRVICEIGGDYEHHEERVGRLVKVGQHRYAITFLDGSGISRSWAASEMYVNMMPEEPREVLQFTVSTGIEVGAIEKFHIDLRRLLTTYKGAITVEAQDDGRTVTVYTGVPELSQNAGTLFLLNTEEGDVRRFVVDIGTDPKLVIGATLPKVTGVILDR